MKNLKFEPLISEIHKLAKKVSRDLPFHATGIEKQLQEALVYEFRKSKKPIEAVREFFGEIYYKDFPVKDYRPDFLIFPDQNLIPDFVKEASKAPLKSYFQNHYDLKLSLVLNP